MGGGRIAHIAQRDDWLAAQATGRYAPPGFEREGFIHCSLPEQVPRVAEERYAGRNDLVLLEIDAERLDAPLREENLEGGEELFPHVYGTIPIASVVAAHPFSSEAGFSLPVSLGGRRRSKSSTDTK